MHPIPPADIRVVLVETSHPGNIGAVARAMKNMGLEQLVLVRPKQFPDPEATARASGADDLLRRARVVDGLQQAIGDCGLVAATTSRDRDQYFRVRDVREGAARIVAHAHSGPVALLFGNERTGLTNDELALAHLLLRIPANPEYASLNLAMAVQLVAYETWRARGAQYESPPMATPLAPAIEMERLFVHLQQVMDEVDFRDRTPGGTSLMNRIRRFLHRAELDQNEVNILRGILTAVQQKRRHAGAPPAGGSDATPPAGVTDPAMPVGGSTTAPPAGGRAAVPPAGVTGPATPVGGSKTAPPTGGRAAIPAEGGTSSASGDAAPPGAPGAMADAAR